jgi:hypothetical protein
MKKLLSGRLPNYLFTSFTWVCTHILIYRSTIYLGQDLDVPTLLSLWVVAIMGHLYIIKHFLFRMLDIYVGMYDTISHS